VKARAVATTRQDLFVVGLIGAAEAEELAALEKVEPAEG